MATTSINNWNKIYGIKRTIWNTDSFYVQNEETQNQYKLDIMEAYDVEEEELTKDRLAEYWYDDVEYNLDCERANLNKRIDGCIIALGYRSSHYGSICGNGREGTKIVGYNVAKILQTSADDADFWAENYNIESRLSDHDGSWYVTYRVCKSMEEAERLQELAYLGKIDNATIMERTKSLYPYIAEIYGWPYRGSKKAA
jgi:hypothetical protein